MAAPRGFDPRKEPTKLVPRLLVAVVGATILSLGYHATEGNGSGTVGLVGSRAEAAVASNDPLALVQSPASDFGVSAIRGEVGHSIYASVSRAGAPPMVALEVVRLLGARFDLTRDLKPSDQFSVVFSHDATGASGGGLTGDVLMVSLDADAGHLSLYRLDRPAGPLFVNQNGQSALPRLLRTPVDGARISSGFGARLHPILGYRRDHQGIDFAADQGTPVLAAAEGKVLDAQMAGGYGQRIRLTHASGMETTYAHLSRFALGVTPGAMVTQGQIIGYVGQTGLATGPHLHFEVREGGIAIDPRTVPNQVEMALNGRDMAELINRKDMLDSFVTGRTVRPAMARLDDLTPLKLASNPVDHDQAPIGTAGLRPLLSR
jgi:murein DD-endopeptidase MepM/ murein hydrolase activator NlpD